MAMGVTETAVDVSPALVPAFVGGCTAEHEQGVDVGAGPVLPGAPSPVPSKKIG